MKTGENEVCTPFLKKLYLPMTTHTALNNKNAEEE